jgi:hypothetical protein
VLQINTTLAGGTGIVEPSKKNIMKKIYILSVSILFLSFQSLAQSYVGEAKINRMPKMAIINELPYSPDVAENGIKKKMSQMGYTGKENDGYLVYKNVSMPDIGPGKYNLYFKADRKSKKDNSQSLVYMLISDSYDAFINETRDGDAVRNGKTFLNTLNVQAESASIDKEISTEEENLKKAEKRYNNAIDDGNDLEKKRRKLEEEIAENKKAQEQRKLDIEKQKLVLEAARNKRKQ